MDGPVHVFDIAGIPRLRQAWELVQELSYVPEDLDLHAFSRHLAQPQLVSARREIEALPDADRIAYELATCAQEQEAPRRAQAPLSRVQAKNGVVKMGPGMDRSRRKLLTDLLTEFFGESVLESGNYLYPPGGFKEWHTNMASVPGWRMYIIRKSAQGRSFFRYVDPVTTALQTRWDSDGQINIFEVRADQPFWHAIASVDAYRWSKGFVIPGNWRDAFGA